MLVPAFQGKKKRIEQIEKDSREIETYRQREREREREKGKEIDSERERRCDPHSLKVDK